MKIKKKKLSYDAVMALPRPEHKKPLRPMFLLQLVIRVLSVWDMLVTRFTADIKGGKEILDEPSLILMNHSSFIDLKIVSKIMFPRRYCIVCTSDGFVGKNWLMRLLGCIPTQKFVSDVQLVSDIQYALKTLKVSVLMYPEASYSFDGTATPLPRRLGVLLRRLDVPVVTITTDGAFLRDPLYNCLQLRKTKVSATVQRLFTREDLKTKSTKELDAELDAAFTFDNFARQYENKVEVTESFRADGLHRILYRCADCGAEGQMEGKGITLTCHACGKQHTLTTLGRLEAADGHTRFAHIPDWYAWERETVRAALVDGSYKLDVPVRIGMLVDTKAIYMVGEGRLVHDNTGFTLTGCDGKLHYTQSPAANYGLYADYYWYQTADVICIGDRDALYYCFPPEGVPVAKARQASEELFKLNKEEKKARRNKTEEE